MFAEFIPVLHEAAEETSATAMILMVILVLALLGMYLLLVFRPATKR